MVQSTKQVGMAQLCGARFLEVPSTQAPQPALTAAYGWCSGERAIIHTVIRLT